MNTSIQTPYAPAAIGPYSQAIKSNQTLYCSGQIPLDPGTGKIIGENIEQQTKQVLKNLEAVLKAGGGSFQQIIKTTVYLKNMEEFPQMNEIYANYFQEPYPARATIEVAKLPKNALVEIECIAETKE